MGCRSGFPTGFQLWVELHGQWKLWSVSGIRAGSGFPKTQESCAHGWSGPGPCESPSHLAGGLDQGFVLRHRVWQVPLCPPLAHTQDVSVFAMQSSSELPTS